MKHNPYLIGKKIALREKNAISRQLVQKVLEKRTHNLVNATDLREKAKRGITNTNLIFGRIPSHDRIFSENAHNTYNKAIKAYDRSTALADKFYRT